MFERKPVASEKFTHTGWFDETGLMVESNATCHSRKISAPFAALKIKKTKHDTNSL